MFEELRGYKSIYLDYSVLFEYAGTPVFDDLLKLLATGIEVYVSKSFKALHYCTLKIKDQKDRNVALAMKKICSALLAEHKMHLIKELETYKVAANITGISDGCCILTTRHSIFTKRLYEKTPDFGCDIAIITQNSLQIFDSVDSMIFNFPPQEPSKLAYNNSYIESFGNASISDIVVTENFEKYELVKRLSGGAEGMVFTTDRDGILAKIYHKGIINPLRWAKLKKLTELGITGTGFCIPQELLFFRNAPVGYTMAFAKGKTLGNVFDGPDAILESFPEWTRLDVVKTILALIEKYLYLHMHDVVAGDIQLKNALINNSSDVYLIDMDSVQVDNLPCPVGTEEFTDQRLWGRNFAQFVRELRDEDYSIAMLVFSVLFCGLHPYATRNGAETLREEIINHNFPYTYDNDPEYVPVGGYAHIWEFLSDRLRKMFYDTFKNGISYETLEWLDAVVKYKEDLENFVYDDPEAYKLFPKEDYKQKSVDVEAGRASLGKDEKKENSNNAPQSAAAQVFARENANSQSQSSAASEPAAAPANSGPFKAIAPEPAAPEKPVFEKKVFANAPTGKYVPKNLVPGQDEEMEKRKKFFGLF